MTTTPASGRLAFSDLNLAIGRNSNALLSLDDSNVRALTGSPTGRVAMSTGYGKSLSVGPPFSLSTPAGLANWYDATKVAGYSNGAAVTTLVDQSGNVRTATSTSGTQPTYGASNINGRPALVFPNTNNVMYKCGSVAATAASNVTVALVGAPVAKATYGHFLSTDGTYQAGSLHFLYNGNTANQLQVSVNPGFDMSPTAVGAANGTPELVVMQITNVSNVMACSLRVNGSNVAAASNAAQAIVTSTMDIGGWSGDLARTYVGGLGEIAWWLPGPTSNVSVADVQRIEGYLASKWWGLGSSNTLPSAHPYKNAPP